ncbi:phage major capsid protein, P2 family [Shewanella surugensis]|uniref:Phage major capsid protein, P2 family n=1 Tax=Shewanella surugensis TaxID=212020 RepID=A0ABT0L788_9GAMM|nr:phage major capsid protein, P2 family [Shewanella surugensis]MCL1123536.1 phage major capsid protein, P2 family [Shewanella surugensis]
MNLTEEAKTGLQAYSTNMAKSYGVTVVDKQFSVTAPMELKLRAALLESVAFLKLITMHPVLQIQGQVIKVGNTAIATGRKKDGRFASGQGMTGHDYSLAATDSCAEVTWDMLASWANSGNTNQFMMLMSQNATMRFALDMLRIGFNGVSVSVDSDPEANPLGEDVNKGWLQIVKEKAPDQIMTDPVYFNPDAIGPLKEGEYKTLDALINEMKNTLIHPSLRDHPGLSVLVGSDLTAAAETKMMNAADKPTEQVALAQLSSGYGGLRAYTPPFFPGKRIQLCFPKHLHIYTQKGTSHRKAENVEDRKQHEDKYWRYEGYGVEEFEGFAAIDEANMHIGAAPAPSA